MPPLGSGYSLANLIGIATTPGGNIWMVDGGQGFTTQNTSTTLYRINGSDPSHPSLVAEIDLSAYGGAARVVKSDDSFIFVGLFPLSATNGNRPGTSFEATPFVIIDVNTNTIVGAASVSTDHDNMRVRDFAFDRYGMVFVNATSTQSGLMKIYKYKTSDIIAAFPSVYSAPLNIFPNPTTTTASSGTSLPNSTINVVSTFGFTSPGRLTVQNNLTNPTFVYYSGTTPTSFTGCSGGGGTVSIGNFVQQTGYEHYETITYGGDYLWASTGLYSSFGSDPLFSTPGRIIRIDPDTGSTTTYTGGIPSFGGSGAGNFWGCLYAFDSLWATGADHNNSQNKIFRFNPNTFPSDPVVINVDPGNTLSNTCELAADNTTIWVTNGSNYNTPHNRLFRVSTTPGSEAVIATVNVPNTAGATQSVVLDGVSMWTTVRYDNNPANVGLASVSTGVGTETHLQTFNPTGDFFEPISVTVTGQPNQTLPLEDPRRQIPIWGAAASIFWDGKHMWVSDGDVSGSQSLPNDGSAYGSLTMDPRVRYVRILDVTTNPSKPILVGSIDLYTYGSVSNVRSIRGSNDGKYIYICVRVFYDIIPAAGRVLIVDKNTFQVVGNAEMTVGPIGAEGDSTGARDCAEDNSGQLWVTNSNSFEGNIVERFNIANVISNGTSPTSSNFTLNCLDHAEELAFDGTYIWTSGWEWNTTIQRINPSNNTITSCTDSFPGGRFFQGCTYLFGELWTFDDSNSAIVRLNRSAFVPGGSADMTGDNLAIPTIGFARNSFASDGTHLWAGNSDSNGTPITNVYKINPTPGSVSVLATIPLQYPGDTTTTYSGAFRLAFDGKYMWATTRDKSNPSSPSEPDQNSTIIKIDPVANQQVFQWQGPTRSIWVGNKETPILTKIDTSDPAHLKTSFQLNLSAYGSGIKSIRVYRRHHLDNNVFVGMFPTAGQPGAGSGASNKAPFVIVDASANQIVGVGSVSTGGDISRPTDFAFDEDAFGRHLGHVFVLAPDNHFGGNFGNAIIYKYFWQHVKDAFPAVYATPTAKFTFGSVHFESITFGAGFLWATTGDYNHPGILYRIDPTTGATTTYTDTVSAGRYFTAYYAFGSVWVSGSGAVSANRNKIFRFDPNTFTSGPIATIVVDPTATHSSTLFMTSDESTIWVSSGSNSSDATILYRISTGLGTEAVIANPSIPQTGGFQPNTYGIAWDGQSIWTSVRPDGPVTTGGLASFSTGVGTEAFIALVNPGLILTMPSGIDCD